jgi:sec-independent protein translocase protein TatA
MFGIGQTELIVLLVIVLLIFGPKNLPKLARSMGQAIRDFRSGIKGVEREIADEEDEGPVETSAKLEGKSGNASVSSESSMGEKKAHGPG